jgi:hypothetical protein
MGSSCLASSSGLNDNEAHPRLLLLMTISARHPLTCRIFVPFRSGSMSAEQIA